MSSLKFVLPLGLAIVASLYSAGASARGNSGGGVLVGLNTFYYSTKSEDGRSTPATESKSTLTYLDLNLGYVMSNSMYLGIIYMNDSIDNDSGYVMNQTGYGPSVGYMAPSGWFIVGHYFLDATFDKYAGNGTKWTKGKGLQADFGYMQNIVGAFNLGLQLSYRNLEYTNFNDGTSDDATVKYKRTELMPQFKFVFVF